MANTADDYANWIVANEDKKGTPEFDTVAAAYQEAKSAEAAAPAAVETATKEDSLALRGLEAMGSGVLNTIGGVVEPALQMVTGAVAKPVSDVAALAATGYDAATGNLDSQAAGFKESIQQGMTYQPRTGGGQAVSENVLAPIGSAIDTAAGYVGSGVGSATGSDVAGAGAKEAVLQGIGFLGVKAAPKLGAAVDRSNLAALDNLAKQAAINKQKDIIRAKGMSLGLVAPAQSGMAVTLSRLSGADQALSLKNTQTGTRILAEEVGLPAGAIADADVAALKSTLGQRYQAVERALPRQVLIDSKFKQDVSDIKNKLETEYNSDPSIFTSHKGIIEKLDTQLALKDVSPEILTAKIKQLRNDASALEKKSDASPNEVQLAGANRKLANFYEDLIDRSLGTNHTALANFRDARTKFAKLYDIDAARMADGLIDLQKFSTVVGKYGSDRAVATGNFRTVADFASHYNTVTKPITDVEKLATPSRYELLMTSAGVMGTPATGGLSLLATVPTAMRIFTPIFAKKGWLQGDIRTYDLPTKRKIAAILTGKSGTAMSQATIEAIAQDADKLFHPERYQQESQ